MIYKDRAAAGQVLADALRKYAGRDDVLVLALPRGGVPVAYEVARTLHFPLDVFLVRKLGVPGQKELALGAIASGGIRVLNRDVIRKFKITKADIVAVTTEEEAELHRRELVFRGDVPISQIKGRMVILVDDGLATGATMRAAVAAVNTQKPSRIIVAVPVASRETCTGLSYIVDEMICAQKPTNFESVGQWYEDFTQTTDDEVRNLLAESRKVGAY